MFNVHAPPPGGQPLPSSSSSLTSSQGGSGSAVTPMRRGISPPVLAIRSDGVVLLSTEELGDRDLSGRVLWTAVLLTPEEEGIVRQGAVNTEQEIASKLVARLPRKKSGDA